MTKLYRSSDRISIKVDDITIKISPLSFHQKAEMQSLLITGNPMDIVKAAHYAVRCAVKEISGVKLHDGSQYELEFDGDILSEECVSDLFNIPQKDKIGLICTELLNGIPNGFLDPQTGEKLEGVSIIRSKSPAKKK